LGPPTEALLVHTI